jgi:hypothetical protein
VAVPPGGVYEADATSTITKNSLFTREGAGSADPTTNPAVAPVVVTLSTKPVEEFRVPANVIFEVIDKALI